MGFIFTLLSNISVLLPGKNWADYTSNLSAVDRPKIASVKRGIAYIRHKQHIGISQGEVGGLIARQGPPYLIVRNRRTVRQQSVIYLPTVLCDGHRVAFSRYNTLHQVAVVAWAESVKYPIV